MTKNIEISISDLLTSAKDFIGTWKQVEKGKSVETVQTQVAGS